MENSEHILSSDVIIERAGAIGVPLPRLAAEAGLSASTLYRWNTGGSNSRNLRAVQRVLEARERALLISLLRLHPDMAWNAATGGAA